MYLNRIIFEIHFLSSKSTLEANKCKEPPLLVTGPHVTLWTTEHWRLYSLVCFCISLRSILWDPGAVSGAGEKSKRARKKNLGEEKSRRRRILLRLLDFSFTNLRISYPCLSLFVCNFAVKLAFIPTLLAIMFTIKLWCECHPHSFYQCFNGNCTTFTKGVSHVGR